ncbi:hypothetical protein MBM_00790 [Drepanopeziza brunnea f. sp. 'multigermtubi' MB_m1]|uniref:Uncharacterized protein n=1 Tax=Marssonina brunnea f. sp. multigermtubi (strain MB_m1) TaxID=1072389 RepID=K1X9M1_MARBU|nr:uncharacterized protein MBM_00790 [Drepanopeziza brunnea f. sp. 'multigermtubi' MB_m1]EKD21677.1 hypothetical protein MBM_00790 [Drepanopeziza brunnea f. sp. 'multigermtubi' MB_m1]
MVHGPLGMPRLACQQSKDPQLDNCKAAPAIHSKPNQHDRSTYEQTTTMADRATEPLSKESSRQRATFQEIKEQQATPLSLDSRWTENLTDDEDNTPQPPSPPLRSLKRKEKEEKEEIRKLREEFAKKRKDIEQNIKVIAKQITELRTYAIQSNKELRRSTLAYSTLSIHQSLRNTLIIQEPKSLQRPSNPFFKSYTQFSKKPRPNSNKNSPEIIIGPDNTRSYESYTPKEDPPKPKSIPDKISSRQRQRADFRAQLKQLEKGIQQPEKRIQHPRTLSDLDDDRRKGNERDWQRDRGYGYGRGKNGPPGLPKGFGNGPSKDPGFGNEPPKDLRKRRTTGNYIGNPLPIRPLAKHNTLAYGTPSALNDNGNDFLELRATDPHLRAKELALFARSFLKELKYSRPDDDFKTQLNLVKKENPKTSLSECFKKLAKELKGIQSSLRPGLKDDRSLADKLYSAYKNVPKTTIARMNLAFTSTAAIADIRRAIAFATESSRPAKAKAYASSSEPHDHTYFQHNTSKADSDLDEEYECFIQNR